MKRALITLQRQHIISLPVDDLCRNFLLRPHGIHGDNCPFKRQLIKKTRDRSDFVALAVNRFLADTHAAFMGKGVQNMARFLLLAVLAATQCLAVNSNNTTQILLLAPSDKGTGKSFMVNHAKYRTKGFRRGYPIVKG